MRTFLLKDKSPICKWGLIPEETYFKGEVPEGYSLAISPTPGIVILDVDVNEDKGKNGFLNIPPEILKELEKTLNYSTKRNGKHFWIEYTGDKPLLNRATKFGLDLRTNKGYVKWYLQKDIREYKHLIKKSSEIMNNFLENLFYHKPKISLIKEHNE